MPREISLPAGSTALLSSFARDATPVSKSFTFGSAVEIVVPSLVGNALDPTTIPPAISPVIELEDRKGSKLTLRLAQTDSAGALALAQGLWRQRS